MKNILLASILFSFSSIYAQIDSCDAYSKLNVLSAYNREAYSGNIAHDTFYLVNYFPVETEQGMFEYAKWARQNGYQTLQEKIEYILDGEVLKQEYILNMDKKFDFNNIETFDKEVMKLVAKRKELKLELCNRSRIYSGYSKILNHRFPKSPWGIDSCESYFKENVEKFYNNYILKNKQDAENLYFSHVFEVPSEKCLLQFEKWAKTNGYNTLQRKSEYVIDDREISYRYSLTLERKLDIKSLNDLKIEIERVAGKRKELKAEKCYGTLLGVGKGIIELWKK